MPALWRDFADLLTLVQTRGLCDEVLRILHFFFCESGPLLSDALSLIDASNAFQEGASARHASGAQAQSITAPSAKAAGRSKILKVVFQPSGRCLFRVTGRTRRFVRGWVRKNEFGCRFFNTHTVGMPALCRYICFHDYCSCSQFLKNV